MKKPKVLVTILDLLLKELPSENKTQRFELYIHATFGRSAVVD